jgi:hypothetical protein
VASYGKFAARTLRALRCVYHMCFIMYSCTSSDVTLIMHALTACHHAYMYTATLTEQEVIVLDSDDDNTTTYTTIKVKAEQKAKVKPEVLNGNANGDANGNANGRAQRQRVRPAKPEAGHLIAARLRLERLMAAARELPSCGIAIEL